MEPIRAAPAVWELDGPIITGPRMSKISSMKKTPFMEFTVIIAYIMPESERKNKYFPALPSGGGRGMIRLTSHRKEEGAPWN